MRMWKEEDRKRKEGKEMNLDALLNDVRILSREKDEKITALEATLGVIIQERDELRRKLESHYKTLTKEATVEEAPPGASPAYLILARQSLRRERDRLPGTHHDDICIAVEGILNFLEKK